MNIYLGLSTGFWAGPGGGPANFGRHWGDYAFHWHGRRTREAAVCTCRLCTPTYECTGSSKGGGVLDVEPGFGRGPSCPGQLPATSAVIWALLAWWVCWGTCRIYKPAAHAQL